MNKIDKILKDAEENGIAEEVRNEIQKLNNENNELRRKNQILQIEKSSSKAEQFRQSNKNLKEKNKKLNEELNKLVQKRKISLGHLSREELGVYNRMLTELAEAGVPELYLEIDQQLATFEQIRTRVQSFAEMLI